MGGKNTFLKAFLKNPRQVGALNQTSSFVAKEITKSIDFEKARCLVEFGAGTGNITRKIVKKMHPECVLFCFEIDPSLAKAMEKNISDPRVKIIPDSAENLGKYLEEANIETTDYIISTIPLATLPYRAVKELLSLSFQYLAEGGKFIQVQYSLLNRKHLRMLYYEIGINFVLLNFPPAFIYVCVKK